MEYEHSRNSQHFRCAYRFGAMHAKLSFFFFFKYFSSIRVRSIEIDNHNPCESCLCFHAYWFPFVTVVTSPARSCTRPCVFVCARVWAYASAWAFCERHFSPITRKGNNICNSNSIGYRLLCNRWFIISFCSTDRHLIVVFVYTHLLVVTHTSALCKLILDLW